MFEFIGRVVKTDVLPLVCVCVYRPPSLSTEVFLEEFGMFIDVLFSAYSQCRFIFAGDFTINLLNNELTSSTFLDLMLCHTLYPTILMPTRSTSGSLLDNIFISWPMVYSSFIIESDISDHYPILIKFPYKQLIKLKDNSISVDLKRNFKQSNINKFFNLLSSTDWSNIISCSDPNEAYDMF